MDGRYMKQSTSIYFECRKQASSFNQRLYSRESAAEILGISVSSLANYELGKTIPPIEIIQQMMILYRAPELAYNYCNNCPLNMLKISTEESLESTTLKLLKCFNERKLTYIKERLIDIAEDGQITSDETEELNSILDELDRMAIAISELRLIASRKRGT